MIAPKTTSSQSDVSHIADRNDSDLWAHDMRSALSGVLGGLSLIDLDSITEENQQFLGQANASAKMLLNLLDANAPPDDHPQNTDETLDLRAELSQLKSRWMAEAKAKNIELNFDTPDTAVTAQMAPLNFQRVFNNLIGNAIKFTNAGAVAIKFEVEAANLIAKITDSGDGFSAAALEKLFHFQGRPDNATASGSGLGLFIAKQHVEDVGGSISVDNLQKSGAIVTVTLPYKVQKFAEPKSPKLAKNANLPDLSHLNILLAEDNLTNQMVVKQMLSAMNADYSMASDGIEAMEAFDSGNFDIALIDIEMPRMSGLEVMRAIRQRTDEKAATILVALTAYVLPEHQERIKAAGANGLISKPLTSISELGQNILTYADKPSPIAAMAPNNQSKPPTNIIDMEIYGGLSDMIGPESMTELLGKVEIDIQSVREGVALGLTAKDTAAIGSNTHILISVAGAIGAVSLQNIAQSLNALSKTSNWDAIEKGVKSCISGCDDVLEFVETQLQTD